MKYQLRFGGLFAFAAIGFIGCVCSLVGCGSSEPAGSERAIVYVCRNTHEVFVGPVQPTPARRPRTGERSLMPGLYCPTCEKWHPGPPMEQLQRMKNGVPCPKHRTPMQLDGPVPESAQRLP